MHITIIVCLVNADVSNICTDHPVVAFIHADTAQPLANIGTGTFLRRNIQFQIDLKALFSINTMTVRQGLNQEGGVTALQ